MHKVIHKQQSYCWGGTAVILIYASIVDHALHRKEISDDSPHSIFHKKQTDELQKSVISSLLSVRIKETHWTLWNTLSIEFSINKSAGLLYYFHIVLGPPLLLWICFSLQLLTTPLAWWVASLWLFLQFSICLSAHIYVEYIYFSWSFCCCDKTSWSKSRWKKVVYFVS